MYEQARLKKEEGYVNVFRVLAKWNGRPTTVDPDHYVIEKHYVDEFIPLFDLNSVDGIKRFRSIADVQQYLTDIKNIQPLTYVI